MDWMKSLKISLLFSFLSYSILLGFIIFLDVLWRGDFIFREIAMITGGYMGFVILFLLVEFVVQKIKMKGING